MASVFAWLFNNERGSDMKIVITADEGVSSVSKRQRCTTACDTSSGEDRSPLDPTMSGASVTDTSDQNTLHSTVVLRGHKIVLDSHSEFFRAMHEERWESQVGDKRKLGDGEEVDTVVLRVASPELLPVAEMMVRYMYTEDLSEYNVSQLLGLLPLADEYGLLKLMSACAKHLQAKAFMDWTHSDRLAALHLPSCVQANKDISMMIDTLWHQLWTTDFERLVTEAAGDAVTELWERTYVSATHAAAAAANVLTAAEGLRTALHPMIEALAVMDDGSRANTINAAMGQFAETVQMLADRAPPPPAPLPPANPDAPAAQLLIDHLLANFLNLEEAWNSGDFHKDFISTWKLPHVMALLSHKKLKVASENLVLVAVMCWLQGFQGKKATPEECQQLFSLVRLPQMRPWCVSYFIQMVDSAKLKAVLPRDIVRLLGAYLRSGSKGRKRIEKQPMCKHWGTPRPTVPAKGVLVVELGADELRGLAKELLDDHDLKVSSVLAPENSSTRVDGLLVRPAIWLTRNGATATLNIGCIVDVMLYNGAWGVMEGEDPPEVEVNLTCSSGVAPLSCKKALFQKVGGQQTGQARDVKGMKVRWASHLDMVDIVAALGDAVKGGATVPIKITFKIKDDKS